MDLLSIPAKHPFLLLLLLSLSLDRISYIIPGLFFNNKSLTALKCSQEKEAFKEARSEDKDDSPPAAAAAAKQDPNQPSKAEEEEEEEEEKQQKKKKKKNNNNKTKQNRTNVGNKNAALIVI
jgi:hypothetical protein